MSHNIALPVGIDDFRKIREGEYYFVDKSLLICDVIDDPAEVILLPRPRRFGKTLNLSMLYYYLTLDPHEHYHDLFKDLAIMQAGTAYTSHQNQYPVIFFTLKAIKNANYSQAYQAIASLIADLYKQHKYLLESQQLDQDEKEMFHRILTRKATETEIHNSLRELIRYLHLHHHVRPILLIDEYDSPLHTAYDCGFYDDMVRFMQVFMSEALKGNVHLHKAVITGILRISQASIFSGLNNVMTHSILNTPYSQYFGFLEKEVGELCEKSGALHSIEEIREWYNGYQFGKIQVYNPWSILNYLYYQLPPKPYWVNVANNSLIKKLVEQGGTDVKSQFETLLQGQSVVQMIKEELVFPELLKKENALWNLLLFTGYLTLATGESIVYPYDASLRIPNKEVQCLFEEMVSDWFSTQQLGKRSYDQLLQALVEHNIPAFSRLLQAYIRESDSYFDFNQYTPEQVYHALVLGLVVGLRDQFFIQSNRESGDGRFDVCLFPKHHNRAGILMEFKQTSACAQLTSTAEQALSQIMDQRYGTAFHQQGVNQVLCLGIAFSAREVKIAATMLRL